MKKLISLILALTLAFSLAVPALAATEIETAAAGLAEKGILAGDENGDLKLGNELNRAELAVLLTRLTFAHSEGGLNDWEKTGKLYFGDAKTRTNTFTDVPDWAMAFVEFCFVQELMFGVADGRFDAQSKVSPKMAATVMLRFCGVPETDWNYNTSVEKATALGLAPNVGMGGATILRGTMAVLIARATAFAAEHAPAPSPVAALVPDEAKAQLLEKINAGRAKQGAPELTVLPILADCAQLKAQDFLDNDYFDHDSPRYGAAVDMIFSYVPDALLAGEVLAGRARDASEAYDALYASAAHQVLMMKSDYTHVGLGLTKCDGVGYYWVVQFVQLEK